MPADPSVANLSNAKDKNGFSSSEALSFPVIVKEGNSLKEPAEKYWADRTPDHDDAFGDARAILKGDEDIYPAQRGPDEDKAKLLIETHVRKVGPRRIQDLRAFCQKNLIDAPQRKRVIEQLNMRLLQRGSRSRKFWCLPGQAPPIVLDLSPKREKAVDFPKKHLAHGEKPFPEFINLGHSLRQYSLRQCNPCEMWSLVDRTLCTKVETDVLNPPRQDADAPVVPHKDHKPAGHPPADELTAVEKSIQVYIRDPNKSNRQIAKIVGCSHSLLSSSTMFRKLREAYARKIPKGKKSKNGKIEAEDQESDG